MTIRHKLILTTNKIKTLCGIRCIVFYPQVNKIMNDDNAILHVTFEDSEVNCIVCEKQMKGDNNGTATETNSNNRNNRTETN